MLGPFMEIFELYNMSRLLQYGMASGRKIRKTDSHSKPAIRCNRMHNDCMSWGGFLLQVHNAAAGS